MTMKAKFALAAVAIVAAAALFTAGSSVATADEDKGFTAKCPLSGKPAQEGVAVDYKGKKVYFCCPGCPSGFEADPEKYAKKVEEQWLETGQITQVACPISGKPVNEDVTVALGSAEVAFCCNGCKGKASKASGDELLALVFGDFSKGFTLQTECPVAGKPINVDKSVEYEGQKVYFCCGGCSKKFEADPAKYTAKVPQLNETE